MSVLRIQLLGGLCLDWDGTPLPPIASAPARSLLAYLVTYRERPHTRSLLAGTFWPDLPEATARRRLSRALWEIRRALHPHSVLQTEGDTIQLNPASPLWTDAEEFCRLADQGSGRPPCLSQGPAANLVVPPPTRLETLNQAVELYRGEFLAGYYDEWLLVERERLHELFLAVLARLADGYKARGEYERALVHARRLVSENPWREEACREVMRLCHLLGRDTEALRQYEACRQILAEELDAEPTRETQALAAEIATRLPSDELREEPWLLPATARRARPPLLERPHRLPLVGRQTELAVLLGQIESAAEGEGGLTLIYGESGVGKTRLVQELAYNARWRGFRVAWGRCYELDAPLAYQPLVEALRASLPDPGKVALEPLWRAELSRLLPELATGEVPPPPLAPEEERRRLLEAIARAFLALSHSGLWLVLLEDTHWMDPGSLEALRYLLPRLGGSRLQVVLTARREELAGVAADLLAALENTRLPRRLDLFGLDRVATGELVQRALDLDQLPHHFSARLHAETEGNPFFLIETLRALVDEGLLYRDAAGDWSTPWDESTEDYAELPLPAGVAQSIGRRLDRLPSHLEELLSCAAVIGKGVPFELWQRSSGRSGEALLTAGKELCARGLLVGAGPEASPEADYLFVHDQVRHVTYDRLEPPRRRLLHRRVAEALTALGPDEPATLAYHWTRAGVWDRAADCHQEAGDRARTVYANAQAIGHYTQAMEALERVPGSPDPVRQFELLFARERVTQQLGERASQADDLAALERLAERLGDNQRRMQVLLHRAEYAVATCDYTAGIAAARTAIHLAQAVSAVGPEARGHVSWGWALQYQGDYEAALMQFGQALALARAAGAHRTEASALSAIGSVRWMQDASSGARTQHEQALQLYRQIGDRHGQSAALHQLGNACWLLSDHAEAEGYFQQALRLEREIGNRMPEGRTLASLGIVYWHLGDYTSARDCFEQSLIIACETTDRENQSIALSNLARISHYLDDNQAARGYALESRAIAREISAPYVEGYALTHLGHALAGLGHWAEAAEAYREAIALRRGLGQIKFAQESLAGLARVHLSQGDAARACVLVEEILDRIESQGLAGMIEPFQVYLTCHAVLEASGDPRAQEVLATAHRLLQEQAARIPDEGTRHLFLEGVAAHRELVALCCQPHTPEKTTVRLPRADAALGRPLCDGEQVNVTWTVHAPDDQKIPETTARRRHRLRRLLVEAQAQGAAPSQAHLAEALGVSRRTVERDLAILRRGQPDLPPTRGQS